MNIYIYLYIYIFSTAYHLLSIAYCLYDILHMGPYLAQYRRLTHIDKIKQILTINDKYWQRQTFFWKKAGRYKKKCGRQFSRKHGLGLPIHIKMLVILKNVWYRRMLVFNRALYRVLYCPAYSAYSVFICICIYIYIYIYICMYHECWPCQERWVWQLVWSFDWEAPLCSIGSKNSKQICEIRISDQIRTNPVLGFLLSIYQSWYMWVGFGAAMTLQTQLWIGKLWFLLLLWFCFHRKWVLNLTCDKQD